MHRHPPAFLVFGHRGARGHLPENTLASIEKALELGATGIEIDVHLVDGHLVVFHDARLERATNGRGKIAEKSFAYLRSLDAGGGQKIPTVGEVLRLVDRRAVVNIELKGGGTAAPVVEVINRHVAEHGWRYPDFLVSSFRHRELGAVHALSGHIRIGVLTNRRLGRHWRTARDLRAWSLNPSLRLATPAFIRRARHHGYKVYVFTVNDPDDIARLRTLGADGVFTDYPERAMQPG